MAAPRPFFLPEAGAAPRIGGSAELNTLARSHGRQPRGPAGTVPAR